MAKNSIKGKNYSDVFEEYPAAAAIMPGHLVELTSAGTVRMHAAAAGNVLPMFALEDELQGKGIDDAYAAPDRVQVWVPTRGCVVLAILKDGENVVAGDFLESAGAGELQKHVSDAWASSDAGTIFPNAIVGVALEAVNMTGSAGVDPSDRIWVRVI